jgi:dihydrofolate reductase
MAHVIHSINITASGQCHHLDSAVDRQHHQYALELTASAEAMMLGRNTFDLFVQFWPGATERDDLPADVVALARAFNRVPKYVVSSRPTELIWNNTTHIKDPTLNKVSRQLAGIPGTVVVFGSPGLATSLLNKGLIDEIHILTQPFIGAQGPQVYKGLERRAQLKLVEAEPLSSEVVLLRYEVIKPVR